MALICTSPPLVEPVSLAELKEFLRIGTADTSQDDTILDLATGARAWCETLTKRRFVKQTWRLLMDFFPGYIDEKLVGQNVSSPFVSGSNAILVGIRYAIVLPYPPVRSIERFQYLDANGGTVQMVGGTDYSQDLDSNPARLTPPFGKMWPVARVEPNAVQVDQVVGYAEPVTATTTAASKNIASSDHVYGSADLGRSISIPGAGASGGTLNTIIAALSSPPAGTAVMRDAATLAVTNATALLVNAAAGNPAHWALIKSAIKFWVNGKFTYRLPDEDIHETVSNLLRPVWVGRI